MKGGISNGSTEYVIRRQYTSVMANQYHNEICSLLEKSGLGYDLSQIQVETRNPSSGMYATILMFKQPCFHVKGKKVKYIYFHPFFARALEKAGYPFGPATSNRWARAAADSFAGFSEILGIVEELYENCLRDSDSFGCCGSYLACSDTGHCIKTDIMFSGKCTYRQNLKVGRIFYGKNKNI